MTKFNSYFFNELKNISIAAIISGIEKNKYSLPARNAKNKRTYPKKVLLSLFIMIIYSLLLKYHAFNDIIKTMKIQKNFIMNFPRIASHGY